MRDRGGRDHGASHRVFQKRVDTELPAMELLNGGVAIMLDCVLQEHRRLALPYAYLVLIRWNEPGELWLDYPELAVQITGSHLGPLYAGLSTHRVFRIREAAGTISPAAVSIARITAQMRK